MPSLVKVQSKHGCLVMTELEVVYPKATGMATHSCEKTIREAFDESGLVSYNKRN